MALDWVAATAAPHLQAVLAIMVLVVLAVARDRLVPAEMNSVIHSALEAAVEQGQGQQLAEMQVYTAVAAAPVEAHRRMAASAETVLLLSYINSCCQLVHFQQIRTITKFALENQTSAGPL